MLFALGFAALLYGLYPPLKAPYITVAGGLLGLEPVARAATKPDGAK